MNVPMRKRHSGGGHHRRNNQRQGRYNNNNNNKGNHSGPPRPRKNFRALQEKFLNQAKEAMSSGDRILAEYYLQHADHYFRMQVEFQEERNRWHEERNANKSKDASSDGDADADADEKAVDTSDADDTPEEGDGDDVDLSGSSSALPAFLTQQMKKKDGEKVVPIQNWEERDAE